ncbi:MAG: glycoside hydrolase family 99-like domain-containing protein [Cytophagaceae bacterium]|nr:glycoside hydrolase family 99-like domain-containing protein [Cytophagaceae bacterium]MBL0325701.1 glycoside hydrolase family 99-like domain-containing protein [Cytophagaceae bacterium]
MPVKPIAIHLPQFHPTPENNEWWGQGFTEWTNVVKAEPNFKGHYQPHLPADLGFYDLRLPDARKAQADLAKAYGIHGFCYYHYWFEGKRLLKEPTEGILESGEPDFPYCLFWANESWSRRWLGEEKEVLMKQTYSDTDDEDHARYLLQFFKDPRYIRVHDRPVFLIYRPYDLPDVKKTIQTFKKISAENNLPEPYLIASNAQDRDKNPLEYGFDDVIFFEPKLYVLSEFTVDGPTWKKFIRNILQGLVSASLKVYPYKQYKERASLVNKNMKYKGLPCTLVGFDNTARRGKNAIAITGQNTSDFEDSLREAVEAVKDRPEDEKIVFINAWNEWAEGNHLEPDQKDGLKYLEIVKKVFVS